MLTTSQYHCCEPQCQAVNHVTTNTAIITVAASVIIIIKFIVTTVLWQQWTTSYPTVDTIIENLWWQRRWIRSSRCAVLSHEVLIRYAQWIGNVNLLEWNFSICQNWRHKILLSFNLKCKKKQWWQNKLLSHNVCINHKQDCQKFFDWIILS